MNEGVARALAKMRRPTALAVAFDYYGLEKLKGVERRMREWAAEAAAAADDEPTRQLLAQLGALFADEDPSRLAERLQRASRLLDEVETPPAAPRRRAAAGPAPDDNIQYLKGVGPARAAAFAALGVTTPRDLLYYFPRKYVDRTAATPIAEVRVGEEVTVDGVVHDIALQRKRFGRTLVTALLGDDSGDMFLKWFNAPYVANKIAAGDRVVASGVVKHYEGPELINPEFEVLGSGGEPGLLGRIVPVYPLSAGLTQKAVRGAAAEAVARYADRLADPLPAAVLAATGFPPLAEALRQIHAPEDLARQRQARRRLSFDHLFVMEVGLALRRRQGLATRGVVVRGDGRLRARVQLPFALTAGQQKALATIDADLAASWPMRRLLQGDVGCGKTVVALLAMLAAAEAGYQTALMAPTEILAQQHWLTAYHLLQGTGVRLERLTAAAGPADRARVKAALRDGTSPLVIGTHALLEDDVVFKSLGLAVVDEQHRFGVDQRRRLAAKGAQPNLLVMTATPIPRTLALCVYGDLELTIIDELPPGRGGATTLVLAARERPRAFELLAREVAAGRQGYVVYPVIDEPETKALHAATAMAAELARGPFKDRRVGLVHGRLDAAARDDVMRRFRAGEVDVLVATTVVEVGLDVANATAMVVEHADRYGLSQLHQLRGRVGRGPHPAHFVAVASAATTDEAKARLATLARTADGFQIAEADLEQRGPGELLGSRQHGLPDFALQALVSDRDLL